LTSEGLGAFTDEKNVAVLVKDRSREVNGMADAANGADGAGTQAFSIHH
jgi:hypothetical protein